MIQAHAREREKMGNTKCSKCGNEISIKDNRRHGILWIVSGLLLFPVLLLISYQTFIPYLSVLIFVIIGISFVFKRERYVRYCKKCNVKISETNCRKV
jgi:hypothetical protein